VKTYKNLQNIFSFKTVLLLYVCTYCVMDHSASVLFHQLERLWMLFCILLKSNFTCIRWLYYGYFWDKILLQYPAPLRVWLHFMHRIVRDNFRVKIGYSKKGGNDYLIVVRKDIRIITDFIFKLFEIVSA